MNDNFHDLFKQSVPEAPSPQGWVQGARRKRRNRQVVAGGVAALVVAGVAVPLALNLTGTAEPIVASPEPVVTSPEPTRSPTPAPTMTALRESPGPTVDPAPTPEVEVSLAPANDGRLGAITCYNEAHEPVRDWINIGTIPTGAARAWLCTNPDNYGTVGPLEPLVADVDGLIEALYAQPELTDDSAKESAEAYTVIFEYDDGRKMSFTGDVQDATQLTDGENLLQGSEAFFHDEVAARWEVQRELAVAPVGEYVPARECPAVSYQQALLPVSLEEITGGYACASDGETSRATELTESLAAQIGREALANAVPVEASEEGGNDVLVLANDWGDQIQLRKAGERYEFRGDDSLVGWTPSPEFAAELDALFAG